MTLGESCVATFRTTTRCACTQGLVTAPRLTMKPDTRRSPMVNRCLRNRGKIPPPAFGLRGGLAQPLAGEAFRPRGTTMSLTMTKEEREAFLADVHVAVISVAEDGHGPLVVPIWYSYQPGGEVRIIAGRTSRQGKLMERAGRFSLCVQTETVPYKFVSVESRLGGGWGPVSSAARRRVATATVCLLVRQTRWHAV